MSEGDAVMLILQHDVKVGTVLTISEERCVVREDNGDIWEAERYLVRKGPLESWMIEAIQGSTDTNCYCRVF